MTASPPPAAPVPLVRVARDPIPDAEKMSLLPLAHSLRAVEAQMPPGARARLEVEFAPYLGKPQVPALVAQRFSDRLCAVCFPGFSRGEAHRQFGRQYTQVHRDTILGWVMWAARPALTLERMLRRSPRTFSVRTNYGTRWVAELGPRHWRHDFEDEIIPPEQLRGSFEQMAVFAKIPDLAVTYTVLGDHHWSFDLAW